MFFNEPFMMILAIIPVILIVIVGVVIYLIINYFRNSMDPMKPKFDVKDFFLNIGAIVSLYAVVGSLINLLFAVINTAYPKVYDTYNYYSYASHSIAWPVAILIVLFPIYLVLMRFMEKEYIVSPEKRTTGLHKFLSYATLFIAGGIFVGDLITVIYYFLNGEELTTGFLLKVLVLLVVSATIFLYYVSDVKGKLTAKSRMTWRIVSAVLVLASIILGFAVIGSPRSQRLYRHDEQKVNHLSQLTSEITSYYSRVGTLPNNLSDITAMGYYYGSVTDLQTGKPYEYRKISETSYEVCAEFNKASREVGSPSRVYPYSNQFFKHNAGRQCFTQTVAPSSIIKPIVR